MKKLNLTEATCLALEGKLLKESKGKKVLLYPSSEYLDRVEPIDITNERGILFGYFNDEEIVAYSTEFNTIQDMEKTVKNKEYMLDLFEDDEDFDNMSGEEWWNYIVKTISDSYVDNDSYMSMFLIDTNNNYKILYCGSEEPDIEIIDISNNSKKINLKFYPNKENPPCPYFKIGKYDLVCTSINSEDIKISVQYFDDLVKEDLFYSESYTDEEIEEKLNIDDIDDIYNLITDEQKIKFLKSFKSFMEYEEAETIKKIQAKNKTYKKLQKELSERYGEEIKLQVVKGIYNFKYRLINSDIQNIQSNLLHFLNKLDWSVDISDIDSYFEKYSIGQPYYKWFEKNYSLINNAIKENTDGKSAYEMIEGIKEGFTSKQQLDLYTNPNFDKWQIYYIIGCIRDEIPLDVIKTFAKPEINSSEIYFIRNCIDKKLDLKQIDNLIKFIKSIKLFDAKYINYLNEYGGSFVISEGLVPALNKNISVEKIINTIKQSTDFHEVVKNLEKLIKK